VFPPPFTNGFQQNGATVVSEGRSTSTEQTTGEHRTQAKTTISQWGVSAAAPLGIYGLDYNNERDATEIRGWGGTSTALKATAIEKTAEVTGDPFVVEENFCGYAHYFFVVTGAGLPCRPRFAFAESSPEELERSDCLPWGRDEALTW